MFFSPSNTKGKISTSSVQSLSSDAIEKIVLLLNHRLGSVGLRPRPTKLIGVVGETPRRGSGGEVQAEKISHDERNLFVTGHIPLWTTDEEVRRVCDCEPRRVGAPRLGQNESDCSLPTLSPFGV